MFLIKSFSNNVYFNLALEEYFLKNFVDPFFIIYRNNKCVVSGKHQNVLAEINCRYVYENDILIARRISGGGTVFHDLGCINFTYIKSLDSSRYLNYYENLKPILDFLKKLSLNVFFDGKNSLLIDNKKISGNSQHIYKDRLLHHGTLLFNSDIEALKNSLTPINKYYIDKAVKSNPHEVVNLKNYISINIEGFENSLYEFIKDYFKAEDYNLNENDLNYINQLVNNKYGTWDWIFGYSPEYSFKKTINYKDEEFQIILEVKRGIIRKISTLNLKDKNLEEHLNNNLLNFPHDLKYLINNNFFKKNRDLLFMLF